MSSSTSPAIRPATVPVARDELATNEELRAVVLTTFFPNSCDPHRTVFVRNLVEAMLSACAIHVVAPIPMRPRVAAWRKLTEVPASEQHRGICLLHPRFLSVPGLHWLSGFSYFLATRPILRQLRRSKGWFVLHAHCAYPDAVGAALAARMLGIPLIVTVHGSDINVVARKMLLRGQIRWALQSAVHVVAVSRALAEQVVALADVGDRLTCVPCGGYAPDVFRPGRQSQVRAALHLSAAGKIAVFVGQLVPVKGVDVLLRAWKVLSTQPAHASTRLVLIGAGPERARLAQLATREGIGRQVSFLGALPQTEVADWIAAADVLCLASHSEGFPNVIVEALASGVPVVATCVGGIPEVVVDGQNGMLAPPGDPACFAAALSSALARTWDAASVSSSVAHLTWERLAERNLQVLRQVAKEAGHAGAA